jgi:hypothetical protein
MKKCVACGKVYPGEAPVCPVDGQPLQPVIPPLAGPVAFDAAARQRREDDDHLKLLAIFHFIVGGLAVCGLLFLYLHYLVMSSVFLNPALWKSQPNATPPPREFFKFFIWFYIFFGIILVTTGLLNLLSGLFLRRRRHRMFSLVIGCLNCVQIPLGTVLGVFTIIVLSRPSVRAGYSE